MMNTFFNAALEAITEEELELNSLFEFNMPNYAKTHHGVCNLYETTFVYVIFKNILKMKFPYSFYWEYPYPGNSKNHCDVALLNELDELMALIEFKLWSKDDDKEIKKDIEKLSTVTDCKKYIFIIGYGGDIEENHQYLTRNHAPLKLVNKKALKTKFYKQAEKKLEDINLNLFMYECVEM